MFKNLDLEMETYPDYSDVIVELRKTIKALIESNEQMKALIDRLQLINVSEHEAFTKHLSEYTLLKQSCFDLASQSYINKELSKELNYASEEPEPEPEPRKICGRRPVVIHSE